MCIRDRLYTAEALQTVEAGLDAGEDVTLAVSQSGRTLMAAAHIPMQFLQLYQNRFPD